MQKLTEVTTTAKQSAIRQWYIAVGQTVTKLPSMLVFSVILHAWMDYLEFRDVNGLHTGTGEEVAIADVLNYWADKIDGKIKKHRRVQ